MTVCSSFSSNDVRSSLTSRISIFHPVSLDVRRRFCPFLPSVSANWSDWTFTIRDFAFSLISMSFMTAGWSAFMTKFFMPSSYFMMSIFSPLSSFVIFLTLMPRIPTQAPMGSICESELATAIFVLDPGSLAIPLIWTIPLWISVTSLSKSRRTNSTLERERIRLGPAPLDSISVIIAFILSPCE